MSEHEQTDDAAERAVDELEERGDRLEGEIDETREDWERKKADPKVPGAAGEEAKVEERRGGPEADYPTKGPPE